MSINRERDELVFALHHTLTVAEGLIEQIRRLRQVIDGELNASQDDLAALMTEEAKWREQIEGLKLRLASFAVSSPERPQ